MQLELTSVDWQTQNENDLKKKRMVKEKYVASQVDSQHSLNVQDFNRNQLSGHCLRSPSERGREKRNIYHHFHKKELRFTHCLLFSFFLVQAREWCDNLVLVFHYSLVYTGQLKKKYNNRIYDLISCLLSLSFLPLPYHFWQQAKGKERRKGVCMKQQLGIRHDMLDYAKQNKNLFSLKVKPNQCQLTILTNINSVFR